METGTLKLVGVACEAPPPHLKKLTDTRLPAVLPPPSEGPQRLSYRTELAFAPKLKSHHNPDR
eukprot:c37301_g1_i1 orf=76-264(+)